MKCRYVALRNFFLIVHFRGPQPPLSQFFGGGITMSVRIYLSSVHTLPTRYTRHHEQPRPPRPHIEIYRYKVPSQCISRTSPPQLRRRHHVEMSAYTYIPYMYHLPGMVRNHELPRPQRPDVSIRGGACSPSLLRGNSCLLYTSPSPRD